MGGAVKGTGSRAGRVRIASGRRAGRRACVVARWGFLLLALLAWSVGGTSSAGAEDRSRARALYGDANAAYQAGRFDDAARGYADVAALGLESAELYYNWGNACLRQGRLGPAILNYRRALRLNPGLVDASSNLTYARRRTADAQATAGDDPFPLLTRLRPGAHRAAGGLLLVLNLTAGLFALRRLWRGAPRVVALLLGIGVAGTLAAALVFLLEQRADAAADDAVVQAVAVDVRSGPGEDNTVAFVLHEGTEVRVGRESNGWLEVALGTELKGWVPLSTVERVR